MHGISEQTIINYQSGYNSGINYADSRVNESSINYSTGYNNGYEEGSSKVTIDGESVKDKMELRSCGYCQKLDKSLPVSLNQFSNSSTVYNDTIYIVLEHSSPYQTSEIGLWRSYDDRGIKVAGFQSASSFPNTYASAHWGKNIVTLEDGIHFLGGYYDDYSGGNYGHIHYRWSGGNAWTQLSDLPVDTFRTPVVVLNNEIHILGGHSSGEERKHYKWDGSTWTQASTLPISASILTKGIIYKNEIHLLDGEKHYKWDGSSWTQVSTLPITMNYSTSCVAYEDELYVFFSVNTSSDDARCIKWNGLSWSIVDLDLYLGNFMSPVVTSSGVYGFYNTFCAKINTNFYKISSI